MILQALDIKDNCTGIFHNGRIVVDPTPELLRKYSLAWKHSDSLEDKNYTYLYIMSRGQPLSSFSKRPQTLVGLNKIFKAHQRASTTAKIDMSQSCFFDMVPEHHMNSWLLERSDALENLWNKCHRNIPSDYDILHKCHVLTANISKRRLRYQGSPKKVEYDIFGSSTGRLTTVKGTFPILNMKKPERVNIQPNNHAFVEFDFNAAEIRTLLGLSGREQPDQDIHNWVSREIFSGEITREEVKRKIFSWLYNFSASDLQLSKIFSREVFRDFYCGDKSYLKTPYGRELKVEERKAQNYLLQSTTSDIVMENSYNIMKFLEGKKTEVAFSLHDSVILDFHKEDLNCLRELKSIFEQTPWGKFKTSCKIGKNFGNMKELQI